MKLLDWRRGCVIAALVVVLFSASVGSVEGQSPTYFTVALTGQSLTAGFNNTVTIVARYNYTSTMNVYPSNAIYDVELAVSIPAPLQVFGDSHWHYNSLALRQSVTVSFQVYAPTAAIGSSYQGSVTLTYRAAGQISYTTETHEVSFSVHGWIKLVLYDVVLTPSVTVPGGNTTVSGNLLNSGNLAAFNANVTVESEALVPGSSASLFLGEVDSNIPRPFSLLVNFRKNIAEGNYTIVVKVSAIDTNTPASPYTAENTASRIQIKRPVVQPPTRTERGGGALIGMILEILRYLWSAFFGPSTLPTLPTLSTFAYSYFGLTPVLVLATRQAV
jgi:hypothetical protein